MDLECLEVLPLHHHDIYREDCANLINSEWQRSHTARLWSLKNSCDNFPTSLVMVYKKSEVVGHSKLSPIPSLPDACFVESVVIAKAHRGKGWGKYLMLATEEYAVRCGVQEIYLSAVDPVPAFYAKLGYVPCEPVCIYGGPVTSSPRSSPATVRGTNTPPPLLSNTPPPPSLNIPPPPPLPSIKFDRNFNRVAKVYMKKVLYEIEL